MVWLPGGENSLSAEADFECVAFHGLFDQQAMAAGLFDQFHGGGFAKAEIVGIELVDQPNDVYVGWSWRRREWRRRGVGQQVVQYGGQAVGAEGVQLDGVVAGAASGHAIDEERNFDG